MCYDENTSQYMESTVSTLADYRTVLIQQLELEYSATPHENSTRINPPDRYRRKNSMSVLQNSFGRTLSCEEPFKRGISSTISTPRNSLTMKNNTKSKNDITELRERLEQLETDRSIFMQEGVFDLIRNVFVETEGRTKTLHTPELDQLIQVNATLRLRLNTCEEALENAKSQINMMHANNGEVERSGIR